VFGPFGPRLKIHNIKKRKRGICSPSPARPLPVLAVLPTPEPCPDIAIEAGLILLNITKTGKKQKLLRIIVRFAQNRRILCDAP
jgi:hypothetical protein